MKNIKNLKNTCFEYNLNNVIESKAKQSKLLVGMLCSSLKYAAFTLAEMMVVMLIVSIFLAAIAPVMTTRMKLSKEKEEAQVVESSVWKWVDDMSGIYFSTDDWYNEKTVMIGQKEVGEGDPAALMVLNTADFDKHIIFKNNNYLMGTLEIGNGSIKLGKISGNRGALLIGQDIDTNNGGASVAIGNNIKAGGNSVLIGEEVTSTNGGSVAIGYKSSIANNAAVAIGSYTVADGDGAIAIGNASEETSQTKASSNNSIAIGNGAMSLADSAIAIKANIPAGAKNAIAIGTGTGSSSPAIGSGAEDAIAIGNGAQALGKYSIAIGKSAKAKAEASVAIGKEAVATKKDQIVLGKESSTVYIPGDLVVGGKAYIGDSLKSDPSLFLAAGQEMYTVGKSGVNLVYSAIASAKYSDIRLKNVGTENKDGLDKIRQLKVFNYTFKKDKEKVPHVGVIAQDLQKVFPNAVKKASDGFLTIRFEDMFYALINAVKELDMRYQAQEESINELESYLDSLEKRVKKLEAKRK